MKSPARRKIPYLEFIVQSNKLKIQVPLHSVLNSLMH